MVHVVLIASLVGASGVSSLASADALNLMQMWKATGTGGDADADPYQVKSWVLALKSDATAEQVKTVCEEFQKPLYLPEEPFCQGFLTEIALYEMLEKYEVTYPGLVVSHEEDPFTNKATEHIIPDNSSSDRRTYPWGIRDINADVVRGRGAGVNVYVLDTGILATHQEFGGRAFAGVDIATHGWFLECTPTDTTCAADENGHGTHVAGTVGASTYGVADGATLWAMKVLDGNGNGFTMWSILAEMWIERSGLRPAVVSISLGGIGTSYAEQITVNRLVDDGVTVVVAGGNLQTDACGYSPANIPATITVASYGGTNGSSSAMSPFSNYGSCVDVWAPGTYIISTYIGSNTALGESSGTSMACPHVSGLAAIMYEDNPTAGSMTAEQRWDLLSASKRTGYVTGIPTTKWLVGGVMKGTVNVVALAPTPAPTPAPTLAPTPAPTPAPTLAPTPAPTPAPTLATPAPTLAPTSPVPSPVTSQSSQGGGAAATGDPHLQNILGERFDLMQPGKQVLLNIPRGMSAENALLRVQADASRLGGRCADMYFQELNITGSWAEASQAGGHHYTVSQLGVMSREWLVFGSVPQQVQMKVVRGRTSGGLQYLNFYVKNLRRVGLPIGGLLGEDDHQDASTPPAACIRVMSLLDFAPLAESDGSSSSSVAEAILD